jgi:hypothetical protein
MRVLASMMRQVCVNGAILSIVSVLVHRGALMVPFGRARSWDVQCKRYIY